MAMIKCTECGKEYSDKASACPNCGCPISYSLVESINDNKSEEFEYETHKEDNELFSENDDNFKKIKEHNKLIVESVILLILGIACIATSQAFGAILFMVLAYACYPKNKNSNNPNKVNNYELQTEKAYKNTLKLTCPNCESDNVTVNVENVANGYSGKSELRKKSVVTNTANSAGRLGMTMMTGGLWLLTPKKSKYKEIQKGKTNYVKITTCICQNCGYSWNK